ncbi:MAG TPA: nicotinate-nucleotide--dimethylbenzimidazole phosphoribosyltransferase [Gammaproteobacteria bacterium]
MNSIAWTTQPAAQPDARYAEHARSRQGLLTKPPGSLGCLEETAILLAALLNSERPSLERIAITVFAADHGVAAEGVSAFPQAVTVEMIKNFSRGGAAISVLARSLGARLEVVDAGALRDVGPLPGVVAHRAGCGTANFCCEAAMTPEQLAIALSAGRQAIDRAIATGAQLFIGGEMGIANTTAASALACAYLSRQPVELTGPGTGLDAAGVSRKAAVIARALSRHRDASGQPLEILRCLGGFEIAALAGAYIAAAQARLPVLVDGFITSTAALAALRINPTIAPWLLLSHASAEPGHRLVVEALGSRPLLDLGMRLGEASGAAVTVPLLRLACELHNNMATFAEAGVSEGSGG